MKQLRTLALSSALVGAANAVYAEGFYDTTGKFAGTYFCQGEVAGGIVYDDTSKKWVGASLRQDDKIVVKLEHGTVVKGEISSIQDYMDYIIKVKGHGGGESRPCVTNLHTGVSYLGILQCQSFANIYIFNFENMRFSNFYIVGYVHGGDDGDSTPSVTAGRCSKIDE